jgi:hypothetical protein
VFSGDLRLRVMALAYFSGAIFIGAMAFFAGLSMKDTGQNPCIRADVEAGAQFDILAGVVICDGTAGRRLP